MRFRNQIQWLLKLWSWFRGDPTDDAGQPLHDVFVDPRTYEFDVMICVMRSSIGPECKSVVHGRVIDWLEKLKGVGLLSETQRLLKPMVVNRLGGNLHNELVSLFDHCFEGPSMTQNKISAGLLCQAAAQVSAKVWNAGNSTDAAQRAKFVSVFKSGLSTDRGKRTASGIAKFVDGEFRQ